MTNVLLDKARAILAQPKQVPSPKLKPLGDRNEAPVTEPAVPAPSPKGIQIEPAPHAKAVYWESGDGRILGPGVPEFFLRDGEEYWISVTFEGHIRFIRDDRLRSKKAFETQRPVREMEPIRF